MVYTTLQVLGGYRLKKPSYIPTELFCFIWHLTMLDPEDRRTVPQVLVDLKTYLGRCPVPGTVVTSLDHDLYRVNLTKCALFIFIA